MTSELIVDLRQPPSQRWRLSEPRLQQARELISAYKADLGMRPDLGEFLAGAAQPLVREDHWAEMEALASALGLPLSDVVLCNLYYDALKTVLGCTAFAVNQNQGVLHARNLDWWTDRAILERYTMVSRFIGGPAGEFVTIGWPGFVGAFSGVAPARFAVTLNAVLSLEPAQLSMPVVFLLRTVLEQARTFDEALAILTSAMIPSDCLLLLTGTRPGELVVIERTPSRHALRSAQAGFVCVTNDYRQLALDTNAPSSQILATSCGRFQRTEALLLDEPPSSPADCLRYLSDPAVRMQITVQQMVFRASTGEYWMQFPSAG